MIDVDAIMQRKDMRTVNSGEIKAMFAEVNRLREQLAAERYKVSLLHDATITLRRAIWFGDHTAMSDALKDSERFLNEVAIIARKEKP